MIVGKYFDLILNSLVAGTPRKISGPRARDLLGLLEMQLALVCGGRDKRGGPTLTFPASTSREKARPEDYSRLLHYLTLVPRFVWKKAVSSFLRPQWWSAPGNSNRFEALLCPRTSPVSNTKFHPRDTFWRCLPSVSDGGDDDNYWSALAETHFRWFTEELEQKFKVIFGQIWYFLEQIWRSGGLL